MVRIPMSREHRAKQFAPFAALRGYEEALRSKERIHVPKAELSEDMLYELDTIMRTVKPMDIVSIIYYDKEEYIKKTGIVTLINTESRFIQIVNTRILFTNIFSIDMV